MCSCPLRVRASFPARTPIPLVSLQTMVVAQSQGAGALRKPTRRKLHPALHRSCGKACFDCGLASAREPYMEKIWILQRDWMHARTHALQRFSANASSRLGLPNTPCGLRIGARSMIA